MECLGLCFVLKWICSECKGEGWKWSQHKYSFCSFNSHNLFHSSRSWFIHICLFCSNGVLLLLMLEICNFRLSCLCVKLVWKRIFYFLNEYPSWSVTAYIEFLLVLMKFQMDSFIVLKYIFIGIKSLWDGDKFMSLLFFFPLKVLCCHLHVW